jgi:hypothetical protein
MVCCIQHEEKKSFYQKEHTQMNEKLKIGVKGKHIAALPKYLYK